MKNLEKVLDGFYKDKTFENIFVRIGKGEQVLYDTSRGAVNENSLFDMASVTKIYATTMLALIAIDKGSLSIDNTVKDFYPSCKKQITVYNLLTHTIGIGYKYLCKTDNTNENIVEKICEIPSDIPIGEDVLYSCPGFIVLGKILEKIYGQSLDKAFENFVAKPLGLTETKFIPQRRENVINANLSEELRGIVNDHNCRFLGQVAGNAGVFSNIVDMTKYVQCLLNKGEPLFSEKTFSLATKNYTSDKSESRGLGFLYVDNRYEQTGGLFADGAIGHCGHTGQSVFLDYRTGLYVVILSDATVATIKKYGAERYDEVMKMRKELHCAIKNDLKF